VSLKQPCPIGAPELTYWWFDPRYGRAYRVHTGTGTAVQAFTPPGQTVDSE